MKFSNLLRKLGRLGIGDKGMDADRGVFHCSGRWTQHVRVSSQMMGLYAKTIANVGHYRVTTLGQPLEVSKSPP